MLTPYLNPYTGIHSAGYRFRFQVRAISRHTLFLPLEMKALQPVKDLLKGVSPLEVFDAPDLKSARKAFCELRKQYDFPFWAATEYYVLNIEDADEVVALCLNHHQHKIIDTFIRNYYDRKVARYVIGKSCGRCGVTTCVQAYITWRQYFWWPKHSNTCAASEINLNPIKTNLCRYLKRDIVPQDKSIYLPKADGRRAFFNTYRSADALRGIDFGYVHFANMSLWHDPDGVNTRRAYAAASGGLLHNYITLLVMEGNVPNTQKLLKLRHPTVNCPIGSQVRSINQLNAVCQNPYFLHEALYSIFGRGRFFQYINLDLIPL